MESEEKVTTPIGTATCKVLKQQPVLATILRAGAGHAQRAFELFRQGRQCLWAPTAKHNPDGSFDIRLEYMSCPEVKAHHHHQRPDAGYRLLAGKIHPAPQGKGEIKSCTSFVPSPTTVGIEYVLRPNPKRLSGVEILMMSSLPKAISYPGWVMPATWLMEVKCRTKGFPRVLEQFPTYLHKINIPLGC